MFQGQQERLATPLSPDCSPVLPHSLPLIVDGVSYYLHIRWDEGTELTVARVMERGSASALVSPGIEATPENCKRMQDVLGRPVSPHPILRLPLLPSDWCGNG